uniref:ZIP family metal transporter n=1 Tax=Roseihalotalea indica TaxID=2867963 RepID=A0AA49GN46_9BACT|nr:ZIP family metal transporter [Tunicatimonas sp. TK19036]
MFKDLFLRIVGDNTVLQGLAGGVVITFLNMLGALAILLVRKPSERLLDGALGFAAGVMLAASFTSLILPGIEEGGMLAVLIGIVLGTLFLDRADAWVPHVHILITGRIRKEENAEDTEQARAKNSKLMSVVLFIVAITLHNMPEGLAVGVSFGAENLDNALSLMFGIGIQNIPEGLAVAVAARNAGLGGLFYAAITGIRAGLVEIPLALFGAWAVAIAQPIVPYAMGFAAGAMLYVISDEIIPETHSRGNERIATLGLMLGLIIMLTLDVTLG